MTAAMSYSLSEEQRSRFLVPADWAFGMERSVVWSDVDAFGHCNNLSYLRYFEDARNAYLETAGLPPLSPDTPAPVLAEVQARFLRPLAYRDSVLVTARVTRLGRTSFDMTYALWCEGLHAEGSARCVLLINRTGERVPIPDEVRAAIMALDSLAR